MWFRIPKEDSEQPNGKYTEWKEILAEEGKHQCVYCSISEANFGGIRNYHVEHFRPKSIEEFKILENDIKNLFYSCSICNCFKGNDWKKDESDFKYYDPSKIDYSDVFVIEDSFQLDGRCKSSNYMINKLFLNRPQLLIHRREVELEKKLKSAVSELETVIYDFIFSADLTDVKNKSSLAISTEYLTKALKLLSDLKNVVPYKQDQIKR